MTAIAAGSITSRSIRDIRNRISAAPSWRRRKTGCARPGVEKVMLMVRPDNTKVRAFYDRLGYDDAGARDLREVARWPADDAVGAEQSKLRLPRRRLVCRFALRFAGSRRSKQAPARRPLSFFAASARLTAPAQQRLDQHRRVVRRAIDRARNRVGLDQRVRRGRDHARRHLAHPPSDRARNRTPPAARSPACGHGCARSSGSPSVVTIAAVSCSSPFGPIQLSHSPANAIGPPPFRRTK